MSRMPKVNTLLQKNLSEIIAKHLELSSEALVTVKRVKCSADLKKATVFVSVLPFDKTEEVLSELINNRHNLKKFLGRKIKIKYTPELNFRLDKSEKMAEEVFETLDHLE